MKKMLVILLVSTIACVGCTNDSERPTTTASPSTATPTPTPRDEVSAEVEIYSAVIRRLVTEDHTFGGGKSPFKHIYIVNGPMPDPGDFRGDLVGPAPEQFPSDVIAGIGEQLEDLVPVTFVADGKDVRRGDQGMGGVKNRGVIITLGPIDSKKGRVHVSNGLWCGGLCGQWLTYVLRKDGGRWKITGTTGPYIIS